MKPIERLVPSGHSSGPKTTSLTPARASSNKAALAISHRPQRTRGSAHHRSNGGATSSAPTASPSHHVNQMGKKSAQSAFPATDRLVTLVTPQVALTMVLRMAANKVNLKTSWGRSNVLAPLAKRFTKPAPTNASKVLPTAMARDAAVDASVIGVTFANLIRFT